jgi:hypothetical protein
MTDRRNALSELSSSTWKTELWSLVALSRIPCCVIDDKRCEVIKWDYVQVFNGLKTKDLRSKYLALKAHFF